MIAANTNAVRGAKRPRDECEYVTVVVADQMFGLPIERVHDVFLSRAVTPVPLAPCEVLGLLNLRGRVVTVICMRRRLGLPRRENPGEATTVGLDQDGDSYGLVVDGVGEVLCLPASGREPNPIHLDPKWTLLSQGVHRIDDKLLVILDVDAVLALEVGERAA